MPIATDHKQACTRGRGPIEYTHVVPAVAARRLVMANPSFTERAFPLAIAEAGDRKGIDLAPLRAAFALTEDTLSKISDELVSRTKDVELADVDIVICGSGGRGELTAESDADYLVLVESPPEPRALQLLSRAMSQASENVLKRPGSQGLFADLAISAELQARVGLSGDTANNLTRRLLLLTESRSILKPPVRESSISGIMKRYCSDYHPQVMDGPSTQNVPRFLLNDLVRYWRTIAVDFAAKRWNEPEGKSYTRFIKLVHSRKLLFAGSLASLFNISTQVDRSSQGRAYDSMLELLGQDADRTPLERLMLLWDHLDEDGKDSLAVILEKYSSFMAVLADRGKRELIERPSTDAEARLLRDGLSEAGRDIQKSLREIFFSDGLREFTEEYAVF